MTVRDRATRMKYVFWILLLILIVLQQDYWNWDRRELLFGFVPHALAYHAVLCLVTAMFWIFVVNFFWPKELVDNVASDASEIEKGQK